MSISSICATWLNARTPQHANLGIAHAWRDARTPWRASIYTEHVLTHSRAQNCQLNGLSESGRTYIFDESRRRPVVITLVVEQTVASSQQSVERGRVVATRRPVSGGARCVPESSRTSGLSAGSGDLKDRRSTAERCFVLLWGVRSPGARVERQLVWDRRLAVKDDWALSDFLLSRLVEFIFVLGRGFLFYRGSCMLTGHYYILCCCGFVL